MQKANNILTFGIDITSNFSLSFSIRTTLKPKLLIEACFPYAEIYNDCKERMPMYERWAKCGGMHSVNFHILPEAVAIATKKGKWG